MVVEDGEPVIAVEESIRQNVKRRLALGQDSTFTNLENLSTPVFETNISVGSPDNDINLASNP